MRAGPIISSGEWRWIAAISAVVLVLTSLPTIAGYAAQTPEERFNGSVYDPQDVAIHLSAMQQGFRGSWQYQILVTADAHPAGWIRTLYLGLGHASRVTGLSLALMYHAARVVFGAAALAAFYVFAARCLRPVVLRRTAALFFALGSGLGWLQLPLGLNLRPDLSPIDFWLIDGYGFFSLMVFPHFAAVLALLAWGFDRASAYFAEGKPRDLAGMALAGIALQLVQPFAPWILDLTVLTLALAPKIGVRRTLPALLTLAVSQAPYFAYSLTLFGSSPAWRSIQEQTVTLSPPPFGYVLGYGILTPLAIWGAVIAFRRSTARGARLAATWSMVAFALAYLPWNLQRRFTEGVMIPMAILAATGLGYGLLPAVRRLLRARLDHRRWRRARNLTLPASAAVASISSLILAVGGAVFVQSRPEALFDPAPVHAAAARLRTVAVWDQPVMAAERTGQILAAAIGQRVFVGHIIETPFYVQRSDELRSLFDLRTHDSVRLDILSRCGCAYVFFGPYERELGGWNPTGADFLRRTISIDGIRVYRLVPPEGTLNARRPGLAPRS
ncbi:MAG: hypothetical protein WD040_04945 [Anaerolineales bacterium]